MAPCPPFAVFNPSHIKQDVHRRLGRKYNWGFADCLDPEQSDFSRLHKLLLKYMRNELVDTCHGKFEQYEKDQAEKAAQARNTSVSIMEPKSFCWMAMAAAAIGTAGIAYQKFINKQ